MNPMEFYKKGKNLLRSVLARRKWMMAHDVSYIESKFCTDKMANIDYALGRIKTAAEMKTYLEKNETIIRYLIPGNNKKWINELRELIQTNLN